MLSDARGHANLLLVATRMDLRNETNGTNGAEGTGGGVRGQFHNGLSGRTGPQTLPETSSCGDTDLDNCE